jgi:hypothetical protein
MRFRSDSQRRAAFANIFSRDKNSSRGRRFEQKIHARVGRSDSIVTMRSTGSRGMWDIVAITPDKVRLIQAKTHGYLTPSDREKMLEQLQEMPDNVQAELEYYISPRVTKNFTLKKAGEKDWDKVEERLEHFGKVRGYKRQENVETEFSADDKVTRKLIQDIESGLIDINSLSDESLHDVDDYLSRTEENYKVLDDVLKARGPSTVSRMTPFKTIKYKASIHNRPNTNVLISLFKTADKNDIDKFDVSGKLDDAVISKAFKYYADNFEDEYSVNRSRFKDQVKDLLSSKHGRSAIEGMFKGNEIEVDDEV